MSPKEGVIPIEDQVVIDIVIPIELVLWPFVPVVGDTVVIRVFQRQTCTQQSR